MLAAPRLSSATASENEALDARWTVEQFRPTIASPGGRFSLSLRTRVQIDAGGFNQPGNVESVTALNDVEFKHLHSGTLLRRAYLGIEGWAFRDFWYEFRTDFGGDNFRFAEPYVHLARLSYIWRSDDEGPLIRINGGLIKPIFTYNDATSSASLTFLERAAVVNVATSAFGGGAPRLGAELTFQDTDLLRSGDNLVLSAAYTGHVSARTSDIPDDSTADGTHLLGRVAYRLWSDNLSNVQIGASASRILTMGGGAADGAARALVLQDRPEIRVDGNSLVATGPLPARGGGLWGIEAAGNWRSVYLAAEYYELGIERDTACSACVIAGDPEFSGWYVEGSWMLTGETKTYQANALNNGMATYANPQVGTPFALNSGGWGAWEIAVRYSDLDLNWQSGALGTPCPVAGCVRGGEQTIFAVGLNWYLNDNLRLLLDYMVIQVDKLSASGAQIGQDVTVVGTRFQFTN
jgi:phosphate-selective porin OprO/OprP